MSKNKITVNEINAELKITDSLESFLPLVVKDLKQEAPKKSNIYANGFTYTIIGNIGYVYNNGKHKSLTHILEFGTHKQTGKPHFRIVYRKREKDFIEHMKKIDIEIKK